MPSQEKKEKVKRIRKWFEDADSVLVINYKGLSVAEANELRGKLSGQGVQLRVLKNTLTRLALSGANQGELATLIDGPTAVVFAKGDVTGAAKTVKDYSKGRKELFFRGGMLLGRLMTAPDVDRLAALPSRDVLIGQAVGAASAPLGGLVGVCAGPIRKMLGLMSAVAAQNEAQGPVGGASEQEVITQS